jgi:hypothetical protein
MPAMILPLVVWILAGELFFFLLANKKGVSQMRCVLAPVERDLTPPRVLGQFPSAHMLEESDDIIRIDSPVQPPSVPNANGQISQGNGSNTSDRYVFRVNEDRSSQVHKLMLRSKGGFSLSSLRANIQRYVLRLVTKLGERPACQVLEPRSLELSGGGLRKNLCYHG